MLPAKGPNTEKTALSVMSRTTRDNQKARASVLKHLRATELGKLVMMERVFFSPEARPYAEGAVDQLCLELEPAALFALSATPQCLELCRQIHFGGEHVDTTMNWSCREHRCTFTVLTEMEQVSALVDTATDHTRRQALMLLGKEHFTTDNSVIVFGLTNRFCSRHEAVWYVPASIAV